MIRINKDSTQKELWEELKLQRRENRKQRTRIAKLRARIVRLEWDAKIERKVTEHYYEITLDLEAELDKQDKDKD